MKNLDGLLLATFALVIGFHVHLFQVLNAAPALDVRVSAPPPPTFRVTIDECRPEPGKVMVAGWISGPGERTSLHATTAAFQDEANGRLYGMTTDLLRATPFFLEAAKPPQRRGVSATRFVASLNLQMASPGISKGKVLMVYDAHGEALLLPTGCAVP